MTATALGVNTLYKARSQPPPGKNIIFKRTNQCFLLSRPVRHSSSWFCTLLELVVTQGTPEFLREPLLVNGSYLHLRFFFVLGGTFKGSMYLRVPGGTMEVWLSRGVALS